MSTMTIDRPVARPYAARQGSVRLTRRGRLVALVLALVAVLAVGLLLASGSVATGEAGTPEPTRVVMVSSGDTLWASRPTSPTTARSADGRPDRGGSSGWSPAWSSPAEAPVPVVAPTPTEQTSPTASTPADESAKTRGGTDRSRPSRRLRMLPGGAAAADRSGRAAVSGLVGAGPGDAEPAGIRATSISPTNRQATAPADASPRNPHADESPPRAVLPK